jgi:hypothetical protein
MRCAVRVLTLAAVLLVAGCSLFRDSDVQVAAITSVVAPDTVRVDSAFHAMVGACLGPTSGYVLDRFGVSSSGAELTVQAWSRFSPEGTSVFEVPSYGGFGVDARPSEPGTFRIIAIQPDGRDTLKTITVLP